MNCSEPTNPPTTHTPQRRQGGFILTVELLLILTILVIGSAVGLVAIRDALVKRMANQQSQAITVVDANGTALGPAIGFDEHEAPLLPYIDRSVPPLAPDPAHQSYRALLAVRDDRFTSREPVYYEGQNCSGTPCLKGSSDEATDSIGVDRLAETGAVSYLYAVQDSPTYAVGASDDGIRGKLYRSVPQTCPFDAGAVQSRYLSQRVVSGSPCEAFELGAGGEPDTRCLVDIGEACSCPSGYVSQGEVLDRYQEPTAQLLDSTLDQVTSLLPTLPINTAVEVGEICCPAGTRLRDDGDLSSTVTYLIITNLLEGSALSDREIRALSRRILDPLAGSLYCEPTAELLAAQSVPDPNDEQRNALDRFTPPFRVNLPLPDTGNPDDTWISTPPDGEGRP